MTSKEQTKTKCTHCHEEIDANLNKCSKCHTDQRSWLNRHFIPVAILFVIFIAYVGIKYAPSTEMSTTQKIGDNKQETKPAVGEVKDQTYKIGDIVTVLDSEFVVNSARRTRRIGYNEANANKEYVVVTITLKNKSKDKDISFSRTDFKVRDEQGVQDDYSSSSYSLDDDLDLDSLAAGGQVAGSMAFEVDRGAKLKLFYQPNFFMEDYRIFVDLGSGTK